MFTVNNGFCINFEVNKFSYRGAYLNLQICTSTAEFVHFKIGAKLLLTVNANENGKLSFICEIFICRLIAGTATSLRIGRNCFYTIFVRTYHTQRDRSRHGLLFPAPKSSDAKREWDCPRGPKSVFQV